MSDRTERMMSVLTSFETVLAKCFAMSGEPSPEDCFLLQDAAHMAFSTCPEFQDAYNAKHGPGRILYRKDVVVLYDSFRVFLNEYWEDLGKEKQYFGQLCKKYPRP